MGRGQELLDAARKADRSTVEKIIGQITKRSGPFPSIRRGPGVNVRDDNGYTPLHHACLNGHEDIVQLLLAAEASPCVVDKIGATPLHLAAFNGHSTVVAMLLAHNNPPVNIDQLTLNQDTALLMAAGFGHKDIVSMLVSRGADVTIVNKAGLNALDLAAQFDKKDVVKLLLRMRPQLIDQYRMPVRDGVIFQNTPLHLASKHGRDDVVRELLSAGVDPNLRTDHGTPLHEAVCFARDSVVRLLLRKGADLKARDIKGRTVLNMLAGYSEESTRSVRQVIQEFKSQRCSYDSEEDLPPFPVIDSPPAPLSLKSSPSFSLQANPMSYVSDSIEQYVTNADPSFQPPSPSLQQNDNTDFFSQSELIIRTDSFLAKQKMLKKILFFDEATSGSKVVINHCELISEIKAITQALSSQALQSKPLIQNEKLINSAVYENVVYNWPHLDCEPVRHGKVENEYYNFEQVNNFGGLTNLEKKAKTELHREYNHLHGANINQIKTIKNTTNYNDFNGFKPKSPEVNREKKIRRDTSENKVTQGEQTNQQLYCEMMGSPIKKVSSHNDFSRINKSPQFERDTNIRRETMDSEFIKSKSQNKINVNENMFDFGHAFRRGTINSGFQADKKDKLYNSNSLPKVNCTQTFKVPRSGTLDSEFKYTVTRANSNSLKKKPRPLPKPKVTHEISDAIDKLNYAQTDASLSLESEHYELQSSFSHAQNIYDDLVSNLPDDMKAHISGNDTVDYLDMQRLPGLRKRFASDFIPSVYKTDFKTDRTIYDRLSLSYDYVNFGEVPDFRDKKLTRNRSIPNCFTYGEKTSSMHLRGAPGCLYELDDYQYMYVVNPRAEREDVLPFIRKKEKATPMPCYCQRKPDVDKSQLFYSCENMADDLDDYCSVDDIHLFDQSAKNDSGSKESTDQADCVEFERKLTGLFKKKFNQFKQLATDWSTNQ